MAKYCWVINPKGVLVEIDKARLPELLAKGYKEASPSSPITTSSKITIIAPQAPSVISPRKKVKFNMPIKIAYPYDGYGRLAEIFSSRLEFNERSRTRVIIGRPNEFERRFEKELIIFFTMFEADRIPDKWVEYCNQADALIVPSQWCRKIFKGSGVKTPIYVVNLGTDDFETFDPPLDEDHPFRFLHYNSFVEGDQKGWELVLRCFINLFRNRQDVELVLKGRKHRWANDTRDLPYYHNIKYIIEDLPRNQLTELFRETHCFVYPSRGEGFGLPPIEMMAHGVPTILTKAHSMTEFSRYGIEIGTTGYCRSYYVGRVWDSGIGRWVKPDVKELEKKMWEVFKNYSYYKKQALKNQKYIKKYFSVETMLENFIKTVEKIKHEKNRMDS